MSPAPKPPRSLGAARLGRVLLAAALGAAGGGLFAWLGLPAPWLTGSMVAVAAAALAGLPLDMPGPLRNVAFVLLGVSMGAGLTPDSIERMVTWPLSLVLLAASVATTMVAGNLYLERVHGWDRTTASFASVPGAFSAVVLLAAASTADLPRVVLAQSLRIFALVALMPVIISLSSAGPAGSIAAAAPATNTPVEVLLTLAASAAAATLLARLRVPAGVILGAMLASAALHATGAVHGRFPVGLVILGFVATGVVIGLRFRGTRLAVLRATLPGAAGSIFVALAISAGFTAVASLLLGLPFGQLWLSYAPGGVEAMAAMALALGLDPAFVGAHHVLRIIGLNVVTPFWLRASRARPKPALTTDGRPVGGPSEAQGQGPDPGPPGRAR